MKRSFGDVRSQAKELGNERNRVPREEVTLGK